MWYERLVKARRASTYQVALYVLFLALEKKRPAFCVAKPWIGDTWDKSLAKMECAS